MFAGRVLHGPLLPFALHQIAHSSQLFLAFEETRLRLAEPLLKSRSFAAESLRLPSESGALFPRQLHFSLCRLQPEKRIKFRKHFHFLKKLFALYLMVQFSISSCFSRSTRTISSLFRRCSSVSCWAARSSTSRKLSSSICNLFFFSSNFVIFMTNFLIVWTLFSLRARDEELANKSQRIVAYLCVSLYLGGP